jgi:phage tail-like protein
MTKSRKDPYKTFNFRLHFGDDPAAVIAGFAEVSGLESKKTARRTAGAKPITLTLKRGLASATSMSELTPGSRALPNRQLTLTLYNESQQAVSRWQLVNPMPAKWTGPSFNAASGEVPVEQLEISVEEIRIANPDNA